MTRSIAIAFGAIGLAACGSSGSGRTGSGTDTTGIGSGGLSTASAGTSAGSAGSAGSGTSTSAGASAGTSTSGGSTSGVTTGDPPKFDLGVIPDAPMPEKGCTKVDFLFVIDNSGSMASHQANLLANFPAFISGIQGSLMQVDSYQVGVVTSDKYSYNVPACQQLSSLVVKTGGSNSSNMTCGPYTDGFNYMTEADDLPTTFNCAAQVGTQGGGFELMMKVVEETVTRVEGDPGECNEGFLRDDALWVIVIITDEADGEGDPEAAYTNPQGGPSTSPGTPMSWFDTVVTARNGEEANTVVLSLIQYPNGPCPPSNDFFDGTNIKDFTEMFTYGFVGGICEPDYGPYFTMATDVIADACDNFKPPG